MPTLDDIALGDSATLDSLADNQFEQPQTTPFSDRNKAAHAALIAQTSPQDAYDVATSDLAQGDSSYVDGLLNAARLNDKNFQREALYSIIGNPEVDQAEQEAAVETYLNEEPVDFKGVIKDEAIVAPSGLEDAESFKMRLTHAEYVDRSNKAQEQINAMLTAQAIATDSRTGRAFLELMEFWFIPLVETNQVADIQANVADGTWSAGEGGLALMGTAKQDVAQMLMRVPPDDRPEFAAKLIGVVNAESDVFLSSDNQFASYQFLQQVVSDGYISDVEKYFENVITIMEALPFVGGVMKVASRFVKGSRGPSSVLETIGVSNPEQTRTLLRAIEDDPTGEAALAISGVDRDLAIADELLPEILLEGQPVRPKVPNTHDTSSLFINPNQDILPRITQHGAEQFTRAEKDAAAASVINQFRNTTDMILHSDASQIGKREDGLVYINALYGKSDGGWRSASDAVDTAMFNLKKLGVRETDLTVYKLGPDGYRPIAREELSELMVAERAGEFVGGDFRVGVNYAYDITPFDVGQMAQFDVRLNWFDRLVPSLSAKGGMRLQRNILDVASVLHPKLTQSAAAAVDRSAAIEARLLDMGKEFGASFNALDPAHKELVTEWIQRANREGLEMSTRNLVGQGHTRETITALKKWKQYWDTQYVLENRDLVKTLQNQGYGIIEDMAGGNRLLARPIKQMEIANGQKVFDPIQNIVRNLDAGEMRKLYEDGGFVASLRNPVADGVERIVIRNNKRNFIRSLSTNDTVLHYRPGYYTVQYKRPVFIDKIVRDANGVPTGKRVTIATAKNHADADHFLKQQAAREGVPIEEYGEVRGAKEELGRTQDEYWDQQNVQGRTAQMYRGKRLEDADAPVSLSLDQANVLGPVDSMLRAARSVSERVALKDWLEASKQRFVQQYANVLPLQEGVVRFPTNAGEISAGAGKAGNKQVADALSTFEYIQYMENGYINSIDGAFKSFTRSMANIVGERGFGKSEEVLGWVASQNPTGILKGLAFRAYLSTNPLRQILIQSHQAVQLAALSIPDSFRVLTKEAPAMLYMQLKGGKLSDVEWKGLETLSGLPRDVLGVYGEIIDRAGILKAVDKSNLLQGEMKWLADSLQGGGTSVGKVLGQIEAPLRKAGFDLGEQANLLTAFLMFHKREQRALAARGEGTLAFGNEAVDRAVGRARNYTYNMNRAGDMPYNQNSFSLIMQFMQVPHKAMTTMLTNRSLTVAEKSKLIAFNLGMYGIPTAAIGGWLEWASGGNAEVQEAMIDGLEGYALNKTAEMLSGEETRIAWGGLAPIDMYGSLDLITSLWTDGIGVLFTDNPSGQLLFGNNPRLTDAFRRTAGFFNDTLEGNAEPKDIMSVLDSWLSISSGYSNMARSLIALKKGELYNSSSTYLMDEDVSTPEALAVALGFSSYDAAIKFAAGKQMYDSRIDLENDVKQIYNDVKKQLAEDDVRLADQDFAISVINNLWSVFDPETEHAARGILLDLMKRDVRNSTTNGLFLKALRSAGFMGDADYENLVFQLNISEEQKKTLLSAKNRPEEEE